MGRSLRPAAGRLLTGLLLLPVLAACGGPKRLPPLSTTPRPGPDAEAEIQPADPRPLPEHPGPPPIPWLEPAEPLLLLGVGLLEDQARLELRAEGAAWVRDADSGRTLAALETGEPLVCRRQGGGVTWEAGRERGSAQSLALQPIDPGFLVSAPGGSYRGEFLVIPTPGARGLTLVNNVELEDYLKGVVP
ncbi:hypothetical protein FJ250_13550, partial [bacterium]|nr:hypothetical protein [bacterium]